MLPFTVSDSDGASSEKPAGSKRAAGSDVRSVGVTSSVVSPAVASAC